MIRVYKQSREFPSQFFGIRVALCVNGELRQKYFTFRGRAQGEKEKLSAKADALHWAWLMEQKLYQRKNKNLAYERRGRSSAYTTGISGIKMKFGCTTKYRRGEWRKYYAPEFIIHGSHNNKRFTKGISIKKHSFDNAWLEAVQIYALNKEISDYSHLLMRKPNIEQLFIVLRHQRNKGHEIPMSALPDSLHHILESHNRT